MPLSVAVLYNPRGPAIKALAGAAAGAVSQDDLDQARELGARLARVAGRLISRT